MTPYDNIYTRFLNKIDNDKDFFLYNNIPIVEAQEIGMKRCLGLLDEAIEELKLECELGINLDNRDNILTQFNEDLVSSEEDLIANIMYKKYFEKDLVNLKVFKSWFKGSEMNQISPANERRTFLDMFNGIDLRTKKKIKEYEAKDRITGKYKGLEYDEL